MSSKNAAELVEDLNSRVETVCTVLLLLRFKWGSSFLNIYCVVCNRAGRITQQHCA